MVDPDACFLYIKRQLELQLPVVAFQEPDVMQVQVFSQNSNAIIAVDDFTESGFVFSPFLSDRPAILIAGDPIYFVMDSKVETNKKARVKIQIDRAAREAHISLVEKGLKAIAGSVLKKVVLSRKQNLPTQKDPVALFKALLAKYPKAFTYIWYHPRVGLWLGATPETLVAAQGARFMTMALAGTQKYEGTLHVDWGNKEEEEQQLVTGEIVRALENIDIKSLIVGGRQTVRAGELLHLQTLIKGSMGTNTDSLSKILKALHPTPAVCGFPREQALDFIVNEEPYSRDFYTGFLGPINQTKTLQRTNTRRNIENQAYNAITTTSNLYVNLRCMRYLNDQVEVFVGGGIIRFSDPEREWEETVDKMQTMTSII